MTELDEAVGVVPTDGRGSLPFTLLHGEPLVAIASWAVEEARVELLDFNTSWADVVERELPLVVHDPLCPATPATFVAAVLAEAAGTGSVAVGVRPVTDTVKEMDGGIVGATVDRSSLVAVVSPLVLPPEVIAAHDDWPDLDDLPALVDALRERFPVRFVEAPAEARRIADESDLRLLEAASAAR